ncbi:MAG: hypothetical protein M3256_12905 [Actinomycetota bacterium]|nr:hypothetical protein [Actinomycetota bacterium]
MSATATSTAVGAGFLGAASTSLVILGGAALVVIELVRSRTGRPSISPPP